MKVENICSARKYTDKSGNEKTAWRKVGELKTFDNGNQSIELYMNPEVYYGVFEQKKKDEEAF